MGRTQIKGDNIGDYSVGRPDLNTTQSGQAVITKVVESANTGIKINASSGVDAGTGDVSLKLDIDYLDGRYAGINSDAYGFWGIRAGASSALGDALYNWFVIGDSRGICPSGWRVPTYTDMLALNTYLDNGYSGYHLKEVGFTNWDSPNTGADNSTGFTAKGVGHRTENGVFGSYRQEHAFWSTYSSNNDSMRNVSYTMYNYGTFMALSGTRDQRFGNSIRLVKADSTDPGTVTDYDGNVYPTVKIGNQVWMARDLKVTHYNNGNAIPVVPLAASWAALSTGGMCYNTPAALNVHSHDNVTFKDSSTVAFTLNEVSGSEIEISATALGGASTTDISGATAKAAIVDADTLAGVNSEASNVLTRWTWANIKTFLGTVFAALSHAHGNVTTDGKIGSTAALPVITGTGGALQAGAFGTAAGSFCQGNDARLGDVRTPSDASVNYAKMAAEFTGDLTITSNAIDWATGWYKEITLSANTTFTFTNSEKGKVIHLKITGAYVPSFPSGCIVINGGTYAGAKQNNFYIECVNSSTPQFKIVIQTEP